MTTLGALQAAVSYRLGDVSEAIWAAPEIILQIAEGYDLLAEASGVFYDWIYLENLPLSASASQPWEVLLLLTFPGGFIAGQANYTQAWELGISSLIDERTQVGPADSTSPFEATDGLLGRARASTAIPATADLPDTVIGVTRVSWDKRGIDAMEPRRLARVDSRYEITAGEVYGFLWQKDGVRTLRKVRVPAAQAATVTVNGSWGLLRDPTDLSGDTVTGTPNTEPPGFSYSQSWEAQEATFRALPFGPGNYTAAWELPFAQQLTVNPLGPAWYTAPWEWTDGHLATLGLNVLTVTTLAWGISRRIPSHHPMGPSLYGAPRRPYLEGTNVRVEVSRFGQPMAVATDVCELPDRYAVYLRDYAMAQCLGRRGPGQDLKLAAHFLTRWQRDLARVVRRQQTVDTEHLSVMGGDGTPLTQRPPRPARPWAYGSEVR